MTEQTMTKFPVGSWERPDAGGIVRRGEGVSQFFAEFVEKYGEGPHCFASHNYGCKRVAVMEVYGLCFCEAHGEQAAASAFEEIYHDLERKFTDSNRTYATNLDHALRLAMDSLPSFDYEFDQRLRAAFPFDEKAREQVEPETFLYIEARKSGDREAWLGYMPTYDTHRMHCVTVCKHMRLAFEEREIWLVEMLEKEREASAAQAAWALAIEEEADLRQ